MAKLDYQEIMAQAKKRLLTASPQEILSWSVAIRGRRHQYRRMAMSINR